MTEQQLLQSRRDYLKRRRRQIAFGVLIVVIIILLATLLGDGSHKAPRSHHSTTTTAPAAPTTTPPVTTTTQKAPPKVKIPTKSAGRALVNGTKLSGFYYNVSTVGYGYLAPPGTITFGQPTGTPERGIVVLCETKVSRTGRGYCYPKNLLTYPPGTYRYEVEFRSAKGSPFEASNTFETFKIAAKSKTVPTTTTTLQVPPVTTTTTKVPPVTTTTTPPATTTTTLPPVVEPQLDVPLAPQSPVASITAVSGSNTTVDVSWLPPVNDGGAPITLYTVTDAEGNTCTSSSATECTVPGVASGNTDTFDVEATNVVGTGPAASTILNPIQGNWAVTTEGDASQTPVNGVGPDSAALAVYTFADPVGDPAPTGTWDVYNATTSTELCSISSSSLVVGPHRTNGLPVLEGSCPYPPGAITIGQEYETTYSGDLVYAPSTEEWPYTILTSLSVSHTTPGQFTLSSAVGAAETGTIAYIDDGTGGVLCTETVSDGDGNCPLNLSSLPSPVTSIDNMYTAWYSPAPLGGSVDSAYASTTASWFLQNPSAPGAPTDVVATSVDGTSADVSWSTPASDGGATIAKYVVTSDPGNLTCNSSYTPDTYQWNGAPGLDLIGFSAPTPPPPTCTVSGLTAGDPYTFSVTAIQVLTGISSAPSTPTASITASSPPLHLAFTTEPASAAAEWVTLPSFQVSIEDLAGNVVPDSNEAITVIANGSCTLAGQLSETTNDGVATFNDLSISNVGSCTLTATNTSQPEVAGTGATSTSITVTDAVSLTNSTVSTDATTEPADGSTYATISVTLEDAAGNPVIGDGVEVTALSSTAQVSSDGALWYSASNGVSNNTDDNGQISVEVRDSSPETLAFSVTYYNGTNYVSLGTATIAFQPTSSTPGPVSLVTSTVSANETSVPADGSSYATITITLEDAAGNPIPNVDVMAHLASSSAELDWSGTWLAPLSGVPYLVTDNNGQVIFEVRDTSPETVYVYVSGTTNPLTNANPFSLSAIALIFTGQLSFTSGPTPVSGPGQQPTFQVSVEDGDGNVVSSSSDTITISSSCALGGQLSAPANNGVATFSDVVFESNGGGSGCTLTATDTTNSAVSTVTSSSISV